MGIKIPDIGKQVTLESKLPKISPYTFAFLKVYNISNLYNKILFNMLIFN